MTNRGIKCDINYEHVLNVWKAFRMNTIKDYHDFLLKS